MSQFGYGPIDAELQLRAMGAIGATTTGTPIALDFDAAGDFKAVVAVADVEDTTDVGWALAVQVDTSESFGSPVTLWSESNVIAAGVREVPLSGRFVLTKEPGATHMRVVATLSGVGGNMTFGAHLVDMK